MAFSIKIALANSLLGLAALAWILALVRRRVTWRAASIYLPVAGYAAASLASMAFSADPGRGAEELGEVVTLALVPIVVILVDDRRWDRLLMALAGVATLSSLSGLWQYLNATPTPGYRLHGFASHYMTFSGWTLVVILMLVGDIAFNPDRRRLRWAVPAAAVCTVALVLSLTRGAWIGLAIGLVLAAAVRKPLLLLAYPVIGGLLLALLPTAVVRRGATIVDPRHPSNYDRLCMIEAGFGITLDHPLLGVGPGMVETVYDEYRVPDAPRKMVAHLHNNVVQLAAERGLVGVAAYCAILVVFLVHTVSALRRGEQHLAAPMMSCLLAVVGITVAGLFEYNWGDAEVWIPTLTCLSAPFALARTSHRVSIGKTRGPEPAK